MYDYFSHFTRKVAFSADHWRFLSDSFQGHAGISCGFNAIRATEKYDCELGCV